MSIEEIVLALVAMTALAVILVRLRLRRLEAALIAGGAAASFVALRLTFMDIRQAATTAIFLVAYALIALERLHKTTVALAGAVLMLVVGLVSQQEAFHGRGAVDGVDWNTIFLLIGMMIIVNIMRQTGVFEWVAIKSAKLGRGHPVAIMILLSVATAVLSAFLDNVTTVLLTAPAALLVCEALGLDPVPMLMFVVLSSNIGGTATLIGDPPNILIGSAGHLTFLDFLRVDGPIIVIVMAVFALTIKLVMGKRLHVTDEQRRIVAQFRENEAIRDWPLLRRSVLVFGLTLAGFALHGWLHLEMATIALAGAALMMLTHHEGPEEALRDVEWPTIFFFIGLFVMVSALVKAGVVGLLGTAVLHLTAGNVAVMTIFMLWFSAFASSVIGNVPFTATMTALIHSMATTLHPEAADLAVAVHAPNIMPLWWALSLGACLGGNFTLVGAAANLVTVGIAARAGHRISFTRFMKYGVPITLQGLILSTIWLWFLFLR